MSTLKCNGCGRDTNTTLCKYDLRHPELGAEFCYAALENSKWVHGCVPVTDLSKLDKYERLPFDLAILLIKKGGAKNESIN